jgi:AGCS family alanine or glycine:cation symporter
MLEKIMDVTNTICGLPLTIFIICAGIYFSYCVGFFQITHIKKLWGLTFGKMFKKLKKGENLKEDPSYKTIATVLGGTIGAGNVAGVAAAIFVGGPGALFWMWVIALLSMATKCVEVMLATKHQQKDKKGNRYGGPMYYIKTIGGKVGKVLAVIYSIVLLIYVLCDSGFVQINTIATSLVDTFNIPLWPIAVVVGILSLFVIAGGLKRVSHTLEKLVPFMYATYIILALIVIFANIANIPAAIATVVKYAFMPAPVIGGFAGSTVATAISKGAARGIFANEAGLGTSTTVHATTTNDPVTQGLWGMIEVAVVSFMVCTISGLLVMTTGAWSAAGDGGAPMILYAFETLYGQVGKYIVCFVLVTFCYSTYIGFFYEYTTGLGYIVNDKWKNILKWTYAVPAVVAVFLSIDVVWDLLCDTAVGLIVIPNVIALFILRKEIKKTFAEGKKKLSLN